MAQETTDRETKSKLTNLTESKNQNRNLLKKWKIRKFKMYKIKNQSLRMLKKLNHPLWKNKNTKKKYKLLLCKIRLKNQKFRRKRPLLTKSQRLSLKSHNKLQKKRTPLSNLCPLSLYSNLNQLNSQPKNQCKSKNLQSRPKNQFPSLRPNKVKAQHQPIAFQQCRISTQP